MRVYARGERRGEKFVNVKSIIVHEGKWVTKKESLRAGRKRWGVEYYGMVIETHLRKADRWYPVRLDEPTSSRE